MTPKTKKILTKVLVPLFIFVAVFGTFAVVDAQLTLPPDMKIQPNNVFAWSSNLVGKITNEVVSQLMNGIGLGLYTLAGWLITASGWVLEMTVEQTVVKMSDNVRGLAALKTGWVTFRDLSNMVFIFLLLFVAFSTMLGNETYGVKRLLPRIVIVALLLNFSFFLTGIVIDASNIVAARFAKTTNCEAATLGGPATQCSIAAAVMQALKIQTTNDTKKLPDLSQNFLIFVFTILSSLFMAITAFVFFIFAILLVTRFVVLIFILLLSPLAFMSMIVPGIGIATKWRKTLFDQAFFAPLFFLLIWFVLAVITDKTFVGVLGGPPSSFVAAFQATNATVGGEAMRIVLNYIIVTTFLIAALVISKTMANSGGAAVQSFVKWGQRAAGGAVFGKAAFAGRHTLGRVANSPAAQRLAGRLPLVGSFATAGMNKLAKSSFDVRKITAGGPLDLGKAGGVGGFVAAEKRAAARKEYHADAMKDAQVKNTKAGDEAKGEYNKAMNEELKKSADEQRKNIEARKENEKAIDDKTTEEERARKELTDAIKNEATAHTDAEKVIVATRKAAAKQQLDQIALDKAILVGKRDDVAKALAGIEEAKEKRISGKERKAQKLERSANRFGGQKTMWGRIYTGIVSPSASKTAKTIRDSLQSDVRKDEGIKRTAANAQKTALEEERVPLAREYMQYQGEIKNIQEIQKYGTAADLKRKQQELIVAEQEFRDSIRDAEQRGQYGLAEDTRKNLVATQSELTQIANHLTKFGTTANLDDEMRRRQTRSTQLEESIRGIDEKINKIGDIKEDMVADLLEEIRNINRGGTGSAGGGRTTPPATPI